MNDLLSEEHQDAAQFISLRAVQPADAQFLYEVYASTRAEELAQVQWPEAQLQAFLRMQLNARDQSYRMHYPSIDDHVILFKDEPAGRLILVRRDDEIRLADIALLPEYRSAGIGSVLIKGLMDEAKTSGKPIRLQVETQNRGAHSLYERLGFTTASETMTHFQMEYRPAA
ncbi:MAG TPA: GNAT family N-acetyltransferase [Pyrinomonadaceae bacterium]|nr:GNAT family N-acetyltransferase [Pyrinomonadaceae bacterium]